jgi:hypothetical protein
LEELAALIFGVFLLDGKVHQHHCDTSKHIYHASIEKFISTTVRLQNTYTMLPYFNM